MEKNKILRLAGTKPKKMVHGLNPKLKKVTQVPRNQMKSTELSVLLKRFWTVTIGKSSGNEKQEPYLPINLSFSFSFIPADFK